MLEVLLEITKFCDLYLMDRVLDDESEVCVTYHHILITHHVLCNELDGNDAQYFMLYMLQIHHFSVLWIFFYDRMIL